MEYKSTFLPHIQPKYEIFFITFTLYNKTISEFYKSLKQEQDILLDKLLIQKNEKAYIKISNIRKKYFAKFDDFINKLDSSKNYLSNKECANIVVKKLQQFDSSTYKLLAYCIMPNHVHILIDTNIQKKYITKISDNYIHIGKIMQKIKGASAREINILLKKKGKFWLRDYYDHYVRNEKELTNIVNYIKLNPVKAGLVKNWKDWNYTFVSENCN